MTLRGAGALGIRYTVVISVKKTREIISLGEFHDHARGWSAGSRSAVVFFYFL
jgi:hypothetical protein